jgi:glycosyltransferase involved in cell wall biosynthesis
VRILVLSTLPREAPSVRPRVYLYLPALREAGIEAVVSPFFGEAAFRRFYRTGLAGFLGKAAAAVAGYARRAREMTRLGGFDAVLVHREAVPRGNRWILGRLRASGLPYLYDLDDAIYLRPRDFVKEGEDSREAMTRGKDPTEVDDLMRSATAVLAGNAILAARAREIGVTNLVDLPTPVDTATFRPVPRAATASPARIPLVGWIGSPTATYCLRAIAAPLAAAARRRPFRLLVVGASSRVEVPGVEVIHREWSLDREAADYASLDLGLYPLPDNPWTRGKCGYKALLYAASGVPCVASPVGVNGTVVRHGETGFHAATDAEWEEAVVRLLGDPGERQRMGAAGRALVEAEYAVEVLAPRLVAAIRRAVPAGGSR